MHYWCFVTWIHRWSVDSLTKDRNVEGVSMSWQYNAGIVVHTTSPNSTMLCFLDLLYLLVKIYLRQTSFSLWGPHYPHALPMRTCRAVRVRCWHCRIRMTWPLPRWRQVLWPAAKRDRWLVSVSDSLRWRHNSNHQPHDCLLNRLFRRRSKETSKLRVTDLCEGNSPVTGEFPSQKASNVENFSIWWRHHGKTEGTVVDSISSLPCYIHSEYYIKIRVEKMTSALVFGFAYIVQAYSIGNSPSANESTTKKISKYITRIYCKL